MMREKKEKRKGMGIYTHRTSTHLFYQRREGLVNFCLLFHVAPVTHGKKNRWDMESRKLAPTLNGRHNSDLEKKTRLVLPSYGEGRPIGAWHVPATPGDHDGFSEVGMCH